MVCIESACGVIGVGMYQECLWSDWGWYVSRVPVE